MKGIRFQTVKIRRKTVKYFEGEITKVLISEATAPLGFNFLLHPENALEESHFYKIIVPFFEIHLP